MASALENYVGNVQALSAAGSYHELAELHVPDTIELLSKNWSILDNVLETLDYQQHSLGVLFVLIAKFKSASSNSNAESNRLIKLFKDFIAQCNGEQVRFAKQAFYDLCHMFTAYIVDQPNVISGIKTLYNAIEKIRLFDTQLTAVHADLLLVSLKARCFFYAKPLLDIDITNISITPESRDIRNSQTPAECNNDSKYFLLYYYYGGVIYTLLKDFERALYFFEVCVSVPAMAMSHIMLEAYKKFILVSLLEHGKILAMPRYSSQVTTRLLKPLSQPYHDLAVAYSSASSEQLRAVITKYNDVFERDSNVGLVNQVSNSLYKKNIHSLTKTFLTLSFADVVDRVGLNSSAEAEKYIREMIQTGEIYASIDQKAGMVAFKEDPILYNNTASFLKFQRLITDVKLINMQITKMDEEIILNPAYVKKTAANYQDEEGSSTQPTKAFSGDIVD